MCDAVVYLDADLVITCPCPRFDTVFRKTHVPELRGELFSSFLEAGDRQRFEDFVKRGIDGSGQSLHVEITLDSDSRVSAQLFHRCFRTIWGGRATSSVFLRRWTRASTSITPRPLQQLVPLLQQPQPSQQLLCQLQRCQ